MAKQKELVYSAVDITDFDLSDDLTAGARVIAFENVRVGKDYVIAGNFLPGRRNLFFPEHISHAEVYCHKLVTCPRNGALIVYPEDFHINFFCTSPAGEYGDWELFSSKGVEIKSITRKLKVPSEGNLVMPQKRSLIRVKACLTEPCGHLQFYCRPSYLNMHGYRFLSEDLLTIFILKSAHAADGIERYPAIIPVMPETKQTWVAIQSGQTLQLILPIGSKVATDVSPDSMRLVNVCKSLNKRYECFYFRCIRQRKAVEAIFYTLPNNRRGVIALTGFELNGTGQTVPVIQCPSDNCTIFCNGHKNFIFRTVRPLETENDWLDRSYRLRLESTSQWHNEITREPFFESDVTLMGKPQLNLKLINLFDRDVCQAI